jgi:hypothetical protein
VLLTSWAPEVPYGATPSASYVSHGRGFERRVDLICIRIAVGRGQPYRRNAWRAPWRGPRYVVRASEVRTKEAFDAASDRGSRSQPRLESRRTRRRLIRDLAHRLVLGARGTPKMTVGNPLALVRCKKSRTQGRVLDVAAAHHELTREAIKV